MAKFKKEILEAIKSDPDLFIAVAKSLGIKPTSMAETIKRNSNNLNQYSIVTLVASHFGLSPDEVVEENSEEVDKVKEEQS